MECDIRTNLKLKESNGLKLVQSEPQYHLRTKIEIKPKITNRHNTKSTYD